MTSAVKSVRRSVYGMLAAGAACAALAIPAASAAPDDDTPEPGPAVDAPAAPAAVTPAVADDCNAAKLASTISAVTTELSTYFAAHPDANQALIDATRQPAFVAVGQFDDYISAHPDQADELRGIQAPLAAFKDRCGMQVSPTDALTVLADV
jgi:hemophore-related protein